MWSSSRTGTLGFALDGQIIVPRIGIGGQPVDEQQRELLIGPTVDAQVNIRWPTGIGRAVKSACATRILRWCDRTPQRCCGRPALRTSAVTGMPHVARARQGVADLVGRVQRGDGDLHVDDVLGVHAPAPRSIRRGRCERRGARRPCSVVPRCGAPDLAKTGRRAPAPGATRAGSRQSRLCANGRIRWFHSVTRLFDQLPCAAGVVEPARRRPRDAAPRWPAPRSWPGRPARRSLGARSTVSPAGLRRR